MSANKEDTLRQFCDVTGADENRSRFFLESSNWQLEVALSSFYEHGGNADESLNPVAAPAPIPTLSDSDMESPPGSPQHAKKKDTKKTTNTRFATLGSLQQQDSSSDEEEATRRKAQFSAFYCEEATCSKDFTSKKGKGRGKFTRLSNTEDLDALKAEIRRLETENAMLKAELARLIELNSKTQQEGQAFYAGGSERSGQQIIGPGKARKDIVTEMFKSVRERGAVVFEDEPSTASRGRGAFSGVGYRLGQTADDHEQVSPTNPQSASNQENARSVRLRLYREGFTVDDGPLRHYSDSDNAEFLGCIRRGEIPPELSAGGGEVRVSLEDRRHDACPRGTASAHAFSGKGHMLGSPTPPTVGATAAVAADAGDRAANQRAAQAAVGLDETRPATTVQFRLADGTRLTGRFNTTHTVGDLAAFIARAEPSYQRREFALLSAFPSAELHAGDTLATAGLLNATVLQRLK